MSLFFYFSSWGSKATYVYINNFDTAGNFERKWTKLDADNSGYLEKSEFIASEEASKSWEIYSDSGATIHKA